MANGIEVSFTNVRDVIKGLEKKEADLAKAVNATMSDFKNRGPGWLSTAVTHNYNIKKADVSKRQRGVKQNGTVKVAGVSLPNYEIKYTGQRLSPVAFKMQPRTQGGRVKVNIKNGQKRLPPGSFMQDNGHGMAIPFRRKTDARMPISPVLTTSIPQMVGEEHVEKEFFEKVNEQLGKRLDHNIERFCKK